MPSRLLEAHTNKRLVEKLFFDMADACNALGISKPTLYQLIEDGFLGTVKIGTRRFTNRRCIDECFEKLRALNPPLPANAPNNRHRRTAPQDYINEVS